MKTSFLFLVLLLAASPVFAGLTWDKIDAEIPAKVTDTEIRAVFPFKNSGTSAVEILKVRSSCGCTVAEPDKTVYQPGETGSITAIFRPGARTGPQEKNIEVDVAGESEPTILKLKTDIPVALELTPRTLRWSKEEALTPKTLRAIANPDAPIGKIEVTSSTPQLEATLRVVEGTKGVWEIAVQPSGVTQPLRAVLTIRTDWPAENPRLFSEFVAVDR